MNDHRSTSFESNVRNLILNNFLYPVKFHSGTEHWPCYKWAPNDFAAVLGETEVSCRFGCINDHDIQWETSCKYENITLNQFCLWLNSDGRSALEHKGYNTKSHWCYIDYKYMDTLFHHRNRILDGITWDKFGFPELTGKQSTIWIGSKGANTVCHYDSYGCNLVAQIYGRKTWILFPPSDANFLEPTRIPFEESSVFSQVPMNSPIPNAQPYIVTLEPGQILFVPHHWWHHVINDEVSISINVWIPLECDKEERLKESITKTLLFSLMPCNSEKEWLNPNEELLTTEESFTQVQNSLKDLQKVSNKRKRKLSSDEVKLKHEKLSHYSLENIDTSHDCFNSPPLFERIQPCTDLDIMNYFRKNYKVPLSSQEQNSRDNLSEDEAGVNFNFKDFARCILDPRVISVISDIILQRVQH